MSRKPKATMRGDSDRRIPAMDWEEFEAQLSRSASRGTSRTVTDQALRDYFGPEKLARLQQLAQRVRSARQNGSRFGAILSLSPASWAPN